MLRITSSGSTKNTDAFLNRMIKGDLFTSLEGYAEKGVEALRQATPEDSGLTANSWTYEIVKENGRTAIWWNNTNVVNGFHVAIGLQYGHATGNGGWVQGYDYINPALKPIFDDIAIAVWKEVQKS